jgi:hypothetical protein
MVFRSTVHCSLGLPINKHAQAISTGPSNQQLKPTAPAYPIYHFGFPRHVAIPLSSGAKLVQMHSRGQKAGAAYTIMQ